MEPRGAAAGGGSAQEDAAATTGRGLSAVLARAAVLADLTPAPATTLPGATRALDADQPLQSGDPRYRDLTEARGADSLARIERRFRNKQGGKPIHLVFASHRGAGKTTELHRLRAKLSDRYFSLYFEANVEMDAARLEMDDLLLVLARQVAIEMSRIGLPLDAALLEQVSGWFAEVLRSSHVVQTYQAEVEAGVSAGTEVSLLGGLLARITALYKVESEYRDEVKTVLRKYPGALLDNVNNLLRAAHQRLKSERNRELLVIIDNLDRYDPKVIDHLLVRQGDRFESVACNLILTPPIILLYRPESGALTDFFEHELLPAVRLRDRDDAYDALTGRGADLLLEALARRVDLERLIPDDAARRRLVVASGGSIRELIAVTADAVLDANGDTVTLGDVNKAVNRAKGHKRTLLNAKGWATVLARIARDKQINDDAECMEVLHQRLAFQYNGDTWHDVHPLIAELPEFERAKALLDRQAP